MTDKEWKHLIDVKPTEGQLVEYRGVNPECARKEYSSIDTIPRKGHFVKDCGTHWTENLNGFTTERLGVICAPDPKITFWRATRPRVVPAIPSFSFGDDDDHSPLELIPGGAPTGFANTGVSIAEPNYTIIEEGKEVGRFWFDKETGRFKFDGDMETSAQIFAAHIIKVLNR